MCLNAQVIKQIGSKIDNKKYTSYSKCTDAYTFDYFFSQTLLTNEYLIAKTHKILDGEAIW